MEQVEKKLSTLENSVGNLNDGTKIISELNLIIKKIIVNSINSANETESIDERIKLLVAGYQAIMDCCTEFASNFEKEKHTLQTKISVLEEIIDEYIANEDHDLTGE